ncbi:MAG: hypothetical protein ACE141_17425 [Bryobacteraceae bacterium]
MKAGNDDRARLVDRERYLRPLLAAASLTPADLGKSTANALHEYARFMLFIAKMPSASWNSPLIELCRATESEVALALGDLPGFGCLAKCTLGEKAHRLKGLSADKVAVASLVDSGLDSAIVFGVLPNDLLALAGLRARSGAAHGGPDEKHAGEGEVARALALVLGGPQALLPRLVSLRKTAARKKQL